jgi:hypothetical protein
MPQELWLASGVRYKFVLMDALNVVLGTYDNITGTNDVSSQFNISEWLPYVGTPVYVNTTTFTLSGNQTTLFTTGRRVLATTNAGQVYGSVATATFATGVTTIVLVMDAAMVLDVGLSAISYALLNGGTHQSIPAQGATSFAGDVTTSGSVTAAKYGSFAASTALTGYSLYLRDEPTNLTGAGIKFSSNDGSTSYGSIGAFPGSLRFNPGTSGTANAIFAGGVVTSTLQANSSNALYITASSSTSVNTFNPFMRIVDVGDSAPDGIYQFTIPTGSKTLYLQKNTSVSGGFGTFDTPISFGNQINIGTALNEAPSVTLAAASSMQWGSTKSNALIVSGSATITNLGVPPGNVPCVRRVLFLTQCTVSASVSVGGAAFNNSITSATFQPGDNTTWYCNGTNWALIGYYPAYASPIRPIYSGRVLMSGASIANTIIPAGWSVSHGATGVWTLTHTLPTTGNLSYICQAQSEFSTAVLVSQPGSGLFVISASAVPSGALIDTSFNFTVSVAG